ncbi:MAG: transposase [Nitrospirales bacterium]|nr:transposase [Nitrospirales bacterium]
MATYTEQRDDQGRAGVVRNGSHPARDIQTGIGPVTVRVPKVRSRQGEPVTFHSALVPPYVRKTASLEAAIPWLYLKGISTGMCNAHSKRWKEREGFSREVVFFHCHPGSNDLMPG